MTIFAGAKFIFTRTILYFPGFDPRPASTYHSMTSEQFFMHCKDNDLLAKVTNRKRAKDKTHSWEMNCTSKEGEVQTHFKIMAWDDLVRDFWVRSNLVAVLKGAYAFFPALKMGIIKNMTLNSWPIAISASFPFIQVITALLMVISALIGALLLTKGHLVFGALLLAFSLVAIYFIKRWTRIFQVPWLARMIRYITITSQKPVLEEWHRQNVFGDIILSTLQKENQNEVLIVSHSLGTQIALLALSAAIKKNPEIINLAIKERRLVFITLGQNIPIMSNTCLAVANSLKTVGKSEVSWLDISSATDPAATVMIDPYQAQFGGKPRVHIRNANFFKTFSKETYDGRKSNRFDMHFLYLMFPNKNAKLGFNLYNFITSNNLLANKLSKPPLAIKPFYKLGKKS